MCCTRKVKCRLTPIPFTYALHIAPEALNANTALLQDGTSLRKKPKHGHHLLHFRPER